LNFEISHGINYAKKLPSIQTNIKTLMKIDQSKEKLYPWFSIIYKYY